MSASENIWTEKYRPTELDSFDAPEYLKAFLTHALKNGFPHLLLYGPPGSGKTTFAQMLHPTITLNASDERGIDVIRNVIKKNARTVRKHVILLDECENLTKDSQTCLRRILEDYQNTTFIFITNYFSKIIDPLKSRLLKFKFVAKTNNILFKINKNENINLTNENIEKIFSGCNKDLRRSINVMQGIKAICENADSDTIAKCIEDCIGLIPTEILNQFFKLTISELDSFISKFIRDGFSVLQLVTQIAISGFDCKSDKMKGQFYMILADCESKCFNGCSDEIVLRYICNNRILML